MPPTDRRLEDTQIGTKVHPDFGACLQPVLSAGKGSQVVQGLPQVLARAAAPKEFLEFFARNGFALNAKVIQHGTEFGRNKVQRLVLPAQFWASEQFCLKVILHCASHIS